MAKNRYINTEFWVDEYITLLDIIEKYLFLYFLTNHLTIIAGFYKITMRQICFDTGIDSEMVAKILLRFEKANKIIYRDGYLVIVNFLKHQKLNPSTQIAVEKMLANCPEWVREVIGTDCDRLSTDSDKVSHLNLNSEINPNPNITENTERVPNPGISSDEAKSVNAMIDGIKKRLNVTFSLPNESSWHQAATWACENSFTPDQFLDCYDYLKSQPWREGRITPETVANNLPEYILTVTASGAGFVNPLTGRGLK